MWLTTYAAHTPGVSAAANCTVKFDIDNVPQPDALLRILPECGGQSRVDNDDYLEPDAKKVAKAGFEPHLEVVYHLSSFAHKHRFTVKVSLPRWKGDKAGTLPELPTLVNVWKAADWHERECFDLCGVDFIGHPNLTRILLSEDWEGHPLRKDYEFPLEYHGIRGR